MHLKVKFMENHCLQKWSSETLQTCVYDHNKGINYQIVVSKGLYESMKNSVEHQDTR